MRWISLFFMVLMVCVCSGCSTRELEERGFPLAIALDKEEDGMILSFDFPDLSQSSQEKNPTGEQVSFSVESGAYYEAQKTYENNTNLVLDYNHLKAIIISQEFLQDAEAMRDLLSWLEQEEIVARNTCLFVAKEQAAEILTLTKETNGSVGKYLEQMLETQEDFKESKIVTIGSLLNQWHNQNENLLIPVLTNNGNVPSVTEYAVIDAFEYKGNISVEEAMKVFLCQGQLEKFLYHLKSGEVLEIQNPERSIKIESGKEQITVEVVLTGEAQVKKWGMEQILSFGQIEKKLNQQLTKNLALAALELLERPGMDISNSFILLGGYERDLYEQYEGDYHGYQQQLAFRFLVNMNLINE